MSHSGMSVTLDSPLLSFEDLSEGQQGLLVQLRDRIILRDGHFDQDDPLYGDITLLRFLKAQNFKSAKAEKDYLAMKQWRQSLHADEIFPTVLPAQMQFAATFFPKLVGTMDKQGRPLLVWKFSYTMAYLKDWVKLSEQERNKLTAAVCDSVYRYVLPICNHVRSQLKQPLVYSLVTIVDLAGTNLDEWLRIKGHLLNLLPLTKLYPETYDKIIIINSPQAFATAWSWIQSKLNLQLRTDVLDKNYRNSLLQLVEPSNLPEFLGGELKWEPKDRPVVPLELAHLINEWPQGPTYFPPLDVSIKPTISPREHRSSTPRPRTTICSWLKKFFTRRKALNGQDQYVENVSL